MSPICQNIVISVVLKLWKVSIPNRNPLNDTQITSSYTFSAQFNNTTYKNYSRWAVVQVLFNCSGYPSFQIIEINVMKSKQETLCNLDLSNVTNFFSNLRQWLHQKLRNRLYCNSYRSLYYSGIDNWIVYIFKHVMPAFTELRFSKMIWLFVIVI